VASAPSSAIHRWKLDDVASGTATDSIGSADGTVNGVSSVSGDYQGGSAGDGDGVDDYIDTTTLGSFGLNMTSDFAIAFTLDGFTDTSRSHVAGVVNSTDSTFLLIRLAAVKDGDIQMIVSDKNGEDIDAATDSGSLIDDGGKYRVVINKTGNDGTDIEIWINKTEESSSPVFTQNNFQNPTDFDGNFALFARNNAGTIEENLDAILDDVIIYNDSLSSSEIQDDYNIQPWT